MKLYILFSVFLFVFYLQQTKANASQSTTQSASITKKSHPPKKVSKKPNIFQRWVFKILQKKLQRAKEGKKLHWAAIASFVCAVIGLFFLAIPLGYYAISEIKKNPEYKGKTWAILGFVLGIAVLILVVLFLLRILVILSIE